MAQILSFAEKKKQSQVVTPEKTLMAICPECSGQDFKVITDDPICVTEIYGIMCCECQTMIYEMIEEDETIGFTKD